MKRATSWGVGSVSLGVVIVGVLAAAASVTLETSAHDLEPGTITIASIPWAQVTIDGRVVGNTPIVRRSITPGAHRVVLRSADGRTHATTVRVQSGQTTSLRVRIDGPASVDAARPSTAARSDVAPPADRTPSDGTLLVNTIPWSMVHVDGRRVGPTPQRLVVPPGRHMVEMRTQSGRSVRTAVVVERGATVQVVRRFDEGAAP